MKETVVLTPPKRKLNIDADNPDAITFFNVAERFPERYLRSRLVESESQSPRSECNDKKSTKT
jgi:hypothetical protein